MPPRFLLAGLDPSAAMAELTGGEAHHLVHVLRLGPGDEVSVFDGKGREFRAEVAKADGRSVQLRLLGPIEPAAERRIPVTLVQAVLKGSSMDDAVRDAVMMGVSAIVPIVTAHTVARKATSAQGAERWRRIAVASAKQCRRAVVPAVAEPEPFEPWLARSGQGLKLILVEPSIGTRTVHIRTLAAATAPASIVLVIGPEGGWTRAEVDAALVAGHTAVTIGTMTLRAEAVPLAALAALSVLWD